MFFSGYVGIVFLFTSYILKTKTCVDGILRLNEKTSYYALLPFKFQHLKIEFLLPVGQDKQYIQIIIRINLY